MLVRRRAARLTSGSVRARSQTEPAQHSAQRLSASGDHDISENPVRDKTLHRPPAREQTMVN